MTCSTGCCRATGGGREATADGAVSPFRGAVGDRNDLSVPKGAPVRGSLYDADAFGRFSEALARFLGTGKYLVGQTVLVILWVALNTFVIVHHWDPYPYILLNLAFSTQAAYAAPLILLAQNRQDERDRATTERDRQVAARTQADTEYLARELAAVRLAIQRRGDQPGPGRAPGAHSEVNSSRTTPGKAGAAPRPPHPGRTAAGHRQHTRTPGRPGAVRPRTTRTPRKTSAGWVAPLRSVFPDHTASPRRDSMVRKNSTTLHHPNQSQSQDQKRRGNPETPPASAHQAPRFPCSPCTPSCHPPEKIKINVKINVKNARTAAPGGTTRPPDTAAPGTAHGR